MATTYNPTPHDRDAERDLLARAARPAEWVPLPNGRLGLPVPCKKRRIFIATDGRTRLCEHGETASAIAQYASGSCTRPADSACSCMNVDGLTAGRYQKAPPNWPDAPPYYDVLVARDAEAIELPGGRAARRLPHAISNTEVFMLQSGALRCRHGNSESTLRSIEKGGANPRRRPCSCSIGKQSWRCGRLQTLVTRRAF